MLQSTLNLKNAENITKMHYINYMELFSFSENAFLNTKKMSFAVLSFFNQIFYFCPSLPSVKWVGVGKSRECMIQMF